MGDLFVIQSQTVVDIWSYAESDVLSWCIFVSNEWLLLDKPSRWTALFKPKLISNLDESIRRCRFPHYFNRKNISLQSVISLKASEIKLVLIYLLVPLAADYMEEIPDFWHWMSIYVHAIRYVLMLRNTLGPVG